jgi:hypothetical protein
LLSIVKIGACVTSSNLHVALTRFREPMVEVRIAGKIIPVSHIRSQVPARTLILCTRGHVRCYSLRCDLHNTHGAVQQYVDVDGVRSRAQKGATSVCYVFQKGVPCHSPLAAVLGDEKRRLTRLGVDNHGPAHKSATDGHVPTTVQALLPLSTNLVLVVHTVHQDVARSPVAPPPR